MGTRYFDADGRLAVVDDGFKAMASRFVKWNQDGIVEKDVWAAAGAATAMRSRNSPTPRSSSTTRAAGSLRDFRSRSVTPSTGWSCRTRAARVQACRAARRSWPSIRPKTQRGSRAGSNGSHPRPCTPSPRGLAKGGRHCELTPAGTAAITALSLDASKIAPLAYQLQGYPLAGSLFNPVVDRLSQAISGQITLDQADQRISSDVADAIAAAQR